MSKKPEILSVASVARSRLFHIEQVDLLFNNGREVQFERLQSNAAGSVLIIPVGYTHMLSFFAYHTLATPNTTANISSIIFNIVAVLYGSIKKSITSFIYFV